MICVVIGVLNECSIIHKIIFSIHYSYRYEFKNINDYKWLNVRVLKMFSQ